MIQMKDYEKERQRKKVSRTLRKQYSSCSIVHISFLQKLVQEVFNVNLLDLEMALHVQSILYKIPDNSTQENTISSGSSHRNTKQRRPRPNSVKYKTNRFSVVHSIISLTIITVLRALLCILC